MFTRYLAVATCVFVSACSAQNSQSVVAHSDDEELGGSLISIACGDDVNEDGEILDKNGEVTEPALVLASDSSLSTSSENWTLEVKGKTKENFQIKVITDKKNKHIVTSYEAIIVMGQSISGPVGQKYVFDIEKETAKEVNLSGGFAGSITTAIYKCAITVD